MKLILICYSAPLHQDVLDALARVNAASYTLWPKTLGVGRGSSPHLDSPVWPGYNCALAVVVDAATKDPLMQEVRALRQRHREEGIKAFVLPVEEAT